MQKSILPEWRVARYSADPLQRCRQLEAEPLPTSTAALLDEAAAEVPDRLAWHFIDSGETATYRDVQAMVNRVAAGLAGLGVRKGSHVAMMVPNVPQFPLTWLAIGRLGAVMVPVNVSYTGRELDYIVNDGRAEFLVIAEEFLPTLDAMLQRPAHLTDTRVIVVGRARTGMHDWQAVHDAGDLAYRDHEGFVFLVDRISTTCSTSSTPPALPAFPRGCCRRSATGSRRARSTPSATAWPMNAS